MERKVFVLIFGLMMIQMKLCYAFQCFSCDSSSDENCATFKSNTTDTECVGSCAVWIEGTKTLRGCAEDIPETADATKVCDFNGCNKILFPEDRNQCVKCSSDEDFCMTPDADLLRPCKNYVANDFCFTYVINATSAVRGCMSDEDADTTLCNSAGDDCIKCNEAFCNTQSGNSLIECLVCSSDYDSSCGYRQEIATTQTKLCEQLLGRNNLCFAYSNETAFVRGCLVDHLELADECAENSDKCQICDDDNCNAMKIIEEFCVVCDSSTDPNCENLTDNPTETLCGDETIHKSGCYLSDKDGTISRGCVAGLSDDQLSECENGNICKICKGNMCNNKQSFQTCFACNSQNDPNCATLQSPLKQIVCYDYLDKCKVYVKPNMTTHRGCENEMTSDGVECSALSVNCKTCPDNNCNGDIFPPSRLSCHHCSGAHLNDNCYKSLEGDTEVSYPCEIYNFRDSCYFYIDDQRVIHRGCLSDQVNETSLCLKNPDKCLTCQTSNCNEQSVMKAPELTCVTCDTSGGVECNWGWPTTMAAACTKDRYFYEDESCYILPVSDQVIRGCTLDGNVCRVSSYCTLCKDNACNRANIQQQFCYECSTEDNKNCGSEPFHTKNVTCEGIISYEDRGCYTWVDDEKNVKRGCYSDFSFDERSKCQIDNENCERCVDEVNCNKNVKDSSATNSGNVILIILLFVVSAKFYKIE